MKSYSYVLLDPTGNLTCLVTDDVAPEDRAMVTEKLMDRCEQVGYLEAPTRPETVAKLRMMGNEFCGNAAMGTAAWLYHREGLDGEKAMLLEVSGTEAPVRCVIRSVEDGWEGTVDMPPVTDIWREMAAGELAAMVRMEGILHMIMAADGMDTAKAESILKVMAERYPDPAVGLLLWDREKRIMTPLVYVRQSGTVVRETACGSGTCAVGAWLALKRGDGVTVSEIRQPGGLIRAEAKVAQGRILRVSISGKVRILDRGNIQIE